jgi:hypothetical protein
MGFFSWNCKSCGHPALVSNATDKGINDWMTDVVVLSKDGSRNFGQYDGYGRAGHWDYNGDDGDDCGGGEPCLYHRACWEVAGKPAYSSPSTNADDQGWFFDDGAHDLLDPRKEHAPGTLETLVAERDGRKRGYTFQKADEEADLGTYKAIRMTIHGQRVEQARGMTLPERKAEFGYDILEYADAKYEDLY